MKITDVFWTTVLLIFYGCMPKDNGSSQPIDKQLDGIEAIMLQQPEILDSLLAKIDTSGITLIEKARISTIRALHQYNNAEFKQCISELEKSETIFTDQGDIYHSNINKLIRAFTFEFIKLDNNASTLYLQCEKYFKTHHHAVFSILTTYILVFFGKILII